MTACTTWRSTRCCTTNFRSLALSGTRLSGCTLPRSPTVTRNQAAAATRIAEHAPVAVGFAVSYVDSYRPFLTRLRDGAVAAASGLVAIGGAVPITTVTYMHRRRVDVHPRVAMRILWHAQIDVTMSVYAEVSDAKALQALKRLGRQLGS